MAKAKANGGDAAPAPASPGESVAEAILKRVKVKGEASVLHKPGAVRLDGYPRLVYAPGQHGPGIRLEDGGATVEDVIAAYRETPDAARVAAKLKTTPEHVADAVRYAAAVGYVEES
jgi:hypothetical protein